jgi:radical SAM protein (TIGR01212 family)
MDNNKRYNNLNDFLKNKFGERVLKICIDGGFTCPNRDGTCGIGGCIFCSERGSGEHLTKSQNIIVSPRPTQQANKFIAYFQNFSNTYADIATLKSKYDEALQNPQIVALAVATRPDCINEDVVKLLKSYSDKYYVYVELGLQTANDETAKFINRGYTSAVFTKAVELLNKYEIDVVTHIMVGLPNETFTDVQNTVAFINKHKIQGLKIHSTYVIKNTKLCELYEAGNYTPLTLEEYIDAATHILTHISPDIIIHRISGDAPKDALVAPEWNLHKKWIMNGITKKLIEDDLWQGKFFARDKDSL